MIDEFIEYHITDRCNLNCKSCIHFCPLSDKAQDKTIGQIKFDLLSISKFDIRELHLFGGEPFLHKDLMEICEFSRKLFPNTYIVIITNGTIKLNNEQINKLKELNIFVQLSIYPFRNDWKEYYKEYIKLLGSICNNIDTDESIDAIPEVKFQIKPLSNEKINHTPEIIKECRMRYCVQLIDAKLYVCPAIAYFDYFENEFKDQLNIQRTNINKVDYLDLLDKSLTEKDINDFIHNSIPSLCNYCKECIRWNDYNMEWCTWEKSKKSIDEWI